MMKFIVEEKLVSFKTLEQKVFIYVCELAGEITRIMPESYDGSWQKEGIEEDTGIRDTIKRHKQHYTKYFEPYKLHDMKLSMIDTLILETECNRIVREFNLSRKDWVNAKTILNGMFDFPKRKK